MKKNLIYAAIVALALNAVQTNTLAADALPSSQAIAATSQIVTAANAFLATLDDKQRAAVLFKFDDEKQRAKWSNFPTGFVPRAGLSMAELTDAQQKAVLALLSATLSKDGYEKVEEIRQADEALKTSPRQRPGGGGPGGPPQGGRGPGGRGPGGPSGPGGPGGPPPGSGFRGGGNDGQMFGRNLYYISFLGTPSEKDPWMLQFGGHHLALNITIVGARGILTPSLTGAQPGTYTVNGKTVRPLGKENDLGFALLNALDDTQRKQAILNYQVGDLVLGPGHDGEKIQPEGLKVSTMNEKQRAMLLDLISQWVGIANDSFAATRMEELKAGLNDTWFAWRGPTTVETGKNGSSYYRVQGPKVIIEYSPQPGEDHVHTIYRDPTDDYGRASTAK